MFVEKKGLRVQAAVRTYPFTGGADVLDGTSDGPEGNEADTIKRDNEASAPTR